MLDDREYIMVSSLPDKLTIYIFEIKKKIYVVTYTYLIKNDTLITEVLKSFNGID